MCGKSFKRPQDLKKHIKTHADDSVLLPTPAQSPAYIPLTKHSRSGSTASSADFTAAPSPYSIASIPVSSNSSQGLYSPDSQIAQAAYDATLAPGSQWNVGTGGYVETVNPQNTSKKRSYDYANEFFEDVKRHKITPVYNDDMAARLSALQAWVTDDLFKPNYNTYQIPQPEPIPSQVPYLLPALRTKQDLLAANHFLTSLQTHTFDPQYTTEYIPQFPSYANKTLYPTLDLDYSEPSPVEMAPSTNLYPQLFDQSPSPVPSANYLQMGSRLTYDQTRLVYAGTLQRAPPRAQSTGSDELVQDMEKMDVDSESKEKKPVEGEEKKEVKTRETDAEMKKKHLELIKKLQKLVQEMLLDMNKESESKNEEKMEDVKKESNVPSADTLVSIAAH